ncbi:DUF1684 domain-containing protein [Fibrella forsythiae]|uniref:DUF1684 domain-containing protein n=1 Tax=Fibrella forsythiae TaxID=2817061 RepID=A0ABS3JJT2_9BACT|nr:DUF1684 domain-containing protein [Fibrella forsythiae]MBO0950247.1 DUF1684 domain-containing protein [Fibrella forsythiae]
MRLHHLLLFALFRLPAFAQTPFDQQIADHREQYKAEFLSTKSSPLQSKEAVSLLRFYPADSTYRVTATVQRTPGSVPVDLPTSMANRTATEVPYATLSFVINRKPCQLTVYRSLSLANNPLYRDYLFLPFTDATSGKETYGGGRYLDLRTGQIQNGRLVLDFNKAYNPYCAYKSGYACPIPPAANRLVIPIKAGELTYGGTH